MTTTKKAATGKPVVPVAAVETGTAVETEVVTPPVPAEAFDKKLEGFEDKSTGDDVGADDDETDESESEVKGMPVDPLASPAPAEAFDKKLEGFEDKSAGDDVGADDDETDESESEVKGMSVDPLASYEVTARIKKGKLPHWRGGLWFTREAKTYIMFGAQVSIVQTDQTIQIITMQLIEK